VALTSSNSKSTLTISIRKPIAKMANNPNVKAVLSNSLPLLKISFGSEQVKEPGQHLSRDKAVAAPTVNFNAVSSTGRYLLLNIDLDAPFASFPILGPIMHWLQPDLTTGVTKDNAGFAVLARGKEENGACVDWIGPKPPPGAGPHRYVFLLYEQPKGFEAGKLGWNHGVGRSARMRFDIDGFEKKAGLEKAVGGNWFLSN
jgi:phosphatidylethanolamine-binding protein (PEBP) family uncharacterized protein